MQIKTPIYSALQKYVNEDILRLHMPGHAGCYGMENIGLQNAARFDVTEIPGLDDLHLPDGVIKESQQLLAQAFGARESFFLVNGASSGIQAMFMAYTSSGGKVLLPRNAHRSMYEGMVLSGVEPVYVSCEIERDLGIVTGVRIDAIDEALNSSGDLQAIFLTSPGYYGTCSDIASVAGMASSKGIPLLVDEAHGGHFPFHPGYPQPALKQGANVVVNGLHKTWPVFNQGGVLHLNKDSGNPANLKSALSLLTTTSPSYLIMASVELGRKRMEEEGQDILEKARVLSTSYHRKISQIEGVDCIADQLRHLPSVMGIDPLKVGVSVRGLSISGNELAVLLRRNHHIQVEMSDENTILAMFSMFHGADDWEVFYRALQDLARKYRRDGGCQDRIPVPPSANVVISPRAAFFARKRRCKISEAKELISGEMVAAYPPGIPCLLPGERINEEIIEYIEYLRENRKHVHGAEDPDLQYLQVIDGD